MENNKWDYPMRKLTRAEADQVVAIIWEAMRLNRMGGNLKEIIGSTHAELDKLWDLFQTFKVPGCV